MVAHWQAVGFAHGVMNTDNMSILGLTLDYGPFGFLDAYDPQFICNHTDEQGRYSVINQPGIAHLEFACAGGGAVAYRAWGPVVAGLETFEGHFSGAYRALMRAKLGLKREEEGDDRLIGDLLAVMAKGRADYTLTFRQLPHADGAWLEGFAGLRTEAQAWLSRYRNRTADEVLVSEPSTRNMFCATG